MTLTQLTTTAAALGSAVFGGVLFAFSTFVMPGLDASPSAAAITTMQQINRAAPRSLLAVDMVATLVLCLAAGIAAALRLRHGADLGTVLVVVGAALYVASFVITAAYHIPRNDAFDSVVATGADAARVWHDYAASWELWNHVRAGAALAGAASMMVGLLVRSA
jgi:uncharacterized membrane protein